MQARADGVDWGLGPYVNGVNKSLSVEPLGCWVTSRLSTSCTIGVGWGSGHHYDVRVREVCTDDEVNSEWSQLAGGVTTLLPQRAGDATALAARIGWPSRIVLDWEAGEPGGCVFAGWRVELQQHLTTDWVMWEPCWGLPRNSTQCSVEGLPLSTRWALRVAEACTDANADAVAAQLLGSLVYTREAVAAATPRSFTAVAPDNTSIDLQWREDAGGDCIFQRYAVQILQEDAAQPQWRSERGKSRPRPGQGSGLA